MGGGIDTVLKCLELDPFVIETIYLTIMRGKVSEALGVIPSDEQPTRDELTGYVLHYPAVEDLAWSELYVETCAWLHDREYRRRNQSDGGNSFGKNALSDYDFTRQEPLE